MSDKPVKIVFATSNRDKVLEIKRILGDTLVEVVTMKEQGIDADIVEDGETFEENALIKVNAIRQLTDHIVMADDSGLCIDAMDGELGVHSARFMGHDTSYDIKNNEILKRLDGIDDEKRTARFVCSIACALPGEESFAVTGVMEGVVAKEIKGENGFGYDPIFFLPESGCTSAELSPEDKDRISHRGKALRMMRDELKSRGVI